MSKGILISLKINGYNTTLRIREGGVVEVASLENMHLSATPDEMKSYSEVVAALATLRDSKVVEVL